MPNNGKFTVVAENLRPYRRNTLYGFVDLTIEEIGLTICGCLIQKSHDATWVNFPGTLQVDGNGEIRRGENGKPMYVITNKFRRQDVKDAFARKAVEACLALKPDLFSD